MSNSDRTRQQLRECSQLTGVNPPEGCCARFYPLPHVDRRLQIVQHDNLTEETMPSLRLEITPSCILTASSRSSTLRSPAEEANLTRLASCILPPASWRARPVTIQPPVSRCPPICRWECHGLDERGQPNPSQDPAASHFPKRATRAWLGAMASRSPSLPPSCKRIHWTTLASRLVLGSDSGHWRSWILLGCSASTVTFAVVTRET